MVEILRYESANNNKTIGYVDIRVPITKPTILIFRKVSHVQSGDRRWFNLPSFGREIAGGSKQYHKFYEFETQVNNAALMESLGEKVKQFCEKNGIEAVQPMNFDEFPPQSMDELPF